MKLHVFRTGTEAHGRARDQRFTPTTDAHIDAYWNATLRARPLNTHLGPIRSVTDATWAEVRALIRMVAA